MCVDPNRPTMRFVASQDEERDAELDVEVLYPEAGEKKATWHKAKTLKAKRKDSWHATDDVKLSPGPWRQVRRRAPGRAPLHQRQRPRLLAHRQRLRRPQPPLSNRHGIELAKARRPPAAGLSPSGDSQHKK